MMEEATASTRNRHSHGDENSDESKDTVSSNNHPGQRRRRRTATKSRSTGTRTGNGHGHGHGALSDATARNINAFDGFKLRRLLQSSDLQLPAINTTQQPHGQYSSPTAPSSYDPTRSIGPPVLSPIGSGCRRAVSVSGPEGVRVLEPSFPRESLLHKVIVQTTDGVAEIGDASTMSSMASPASQNDAVSVRVHKTSKPLSHQADPSSLVAIAELSRRYYAPPRPTKSDVAHQFAAHGIGASSQQSHSNPRQPSLIEVGSPIDNNLKSVFSSPMAVILREKVDQYQDMNGIGPATEDADDAFAIQQQNQDSRQTATRSFASLGALARKTFVKGKRFALSRRFNLPTKHKQEQHMRSGEAPKGAAKNLDMIVTTTNTTPSTFDESDELSMISLSPRLATQTTRNSGIAHQRQEIENHCDRAAFERGAEFLLQLGHLLGKTCTTFLTPHTRKRRRRHSRGGDDDDDDDRSAASSLSSIAPRIIVPVASIKNGQQGWKRGLMLCVIFALLMAGICAFMIGTDAVLTLSIIAARKRMFHVSKAEGIVVPKENLSTQMHTARTRVSVLEPSRDKLHGVDKEMELHHHDEAENNFVGLDMRLASAKEIQQDTAEEREEELCDSSDDTVESHVVAAEESPENEKVRAFLTKGKNYNEFVSLQKLLEKIYSHKSTKSRALLRRSRALLAPPFWHLPGTFVVSVPSNNITIPAEVIGTMSRALVYVPPPGALTPIVTMVSSSTVSTYTDDDFSDLYYQTLYNERRDQDFDRPLSQLLAEILQEYRREKRRRNIEHNRLLAITDQDDGASTRTVTKRTKNPLYQIAKWLKKALPSAL